MVKKILIALFVVFLLWINNIFEDRLVKDMDAASRTYGSALSNKNEKLRDDEITSVVKQLLSEKSEAEAVAYLIDAGFEVHSYTKEGFREMPDGKLNPYPDYPSKKSAVGNLDGEATYDARRFYKSFWQIYFLGGLEAHVGFDVKNKQIINIKGHIWYQGL